MKNHSILKGLLSAAILVGAVSAQAAEYLVKYRSSLAIQSLQTLPLTILDQHEPGQLMKVRISDKEKIPTMIRLATDPSVEYVVPNFRIRAFEAPIQREALQNQYALAKVQAEKAWQRAGNRGSRKIVVAVIDTGADYKHKSLAPNMIAGKDFAGNDDDPMDETSMQNPGHGTHCSGIIGASGLIDGGTMGISPEVSIMPLRFLDKNGSGDLNNSIKAIDYAIEKKVDVISASWGAAVPRKTAQPLIEAIERAGKAGIIFVAAAANDGKKNDNYEVYPANAGLSNTISVAASNSSDGKPSWSNYGRGKVNLASPGDAIVSTLPGDKYGNLSGTSMATPLVSGLIAFLKAQDNTLKPEEIRSLLQATGAKVGIQTACDCRVDAFQAVDQILNKKMFVHPQAGTFAIGEKVNFTGIYGKAPFTYTSSTPATATIDAQGVLTAVAAGETTVTVTDSAGQTATSYKIFVGKASNTPDPGNPPGDGDDPGYPGNPGQPGEPGECPIGDPQVCEIICQFQPDLPFCKQ